MSENEEKSFIYLEFDDIGSSEITNYKFENVSPYQLLLAHNLLEFEGKNSLAMQRAAQVQAQMKQSQQEQILVPKPEIKKWD
jgi:hypothetical protein